MTLPGRAVGAGRALTVGEKELFPPGVRFFSVGAGAFGDAGALELADGAVVSAGFSFEPLHAVSAPIPTIATAPVASANCRVKRLENIGASQLSVPGMGLTTDYTDPTALPSSENSMPDVPPERFPGKHGTPAWPHWRNPPPSALSIGRQCYELRMSNRCRECLAGREHCHGTLIRHSDHDWDCTESGCEHPEILVHSLVLDCEAVGCDCYPMGSEASSASSTGWTSATG